MKVSKIELEKMKSDLRVVLNHYNKVHNISFEGFDVFDIPDSICFNLWTIVYSNRRYGNDNSNVIFVNNTRLLEYDENFVFYPCNTNDNTLLTALKKAIKELI
jgi:hypothetical protein